jgi:hypothetical protein
LVAVAILLAAVASPAAAAVPRPGSRALLSKNNNDHKKVVYMDMLFGNDTIQLALAVRSSGMLATGKAPEPRFGSERESRNEP